MYENRAARDGGSMRAENPRVAVVSHGYLLRTTLEPIAHSSWRNAVPTKPISSVFFARAKDIPDGAASPVAHGKLPKIREKVFWLDMKEAAAYLCIESQKDSPKNLSFIYKRKTI